MSLSVYGIATCNGCKKARNWLKEEGIEHTWHDTRQTAPTRKDIAGWVKDLGNKPLRNTSGGSYRALGEEKHNWTDDQWIDAFSKDAMLLKRPLFVKDGTAVLTGFRGTPDQIKTKLGL